MIKSLLKLLIQKLLKPFRFIFSKKTAKKLFIFIAIVLILGIDILLLSAGILSSDSDISRIEDVVSLHEEDILNAIPNNYEIIKEHICSDFELELAYNFDDVYYITITISDDSNDDIEISIKNDDDDSIDYILTEEGSLEKVKDTSSATIDEIIIIVFLVFMLNIALVMFFVWFYIELFA